MRIAGGLPYVAWPFNDLVDTHRETGKRIAPNANKVFRDLAGHASDLGFTDLAEIFCDAFDPDVRNGYAHADYTIHDNQLRLPKKNGGHARIINFGDLQHVLDRGVNFYGILRNVVDEAVHTYDPPRTIRGRLNEEPEGDWTIYYIPGKAFGFTSGTKLPPQP